MKTLKEILVSRGSDKAAKHHYDTVYGPAFEPLRNQPVALLEVGVFKGHSLAAWEEYFINARIVGLDLFERTPLSQVRKAAKESILVKGDSTNPPASLTGPFDIIIDDGCHFPGVQAETLKALWPLLGAGGVYFVEDVWEGKSLSHPWVIKHQDEINPGEISKLRGACDMLRMEDGAEVTFHDLRQETGAPDSFIIELRKP